jgi:hypothetical protein
MNDVELAWVWFACAHFIVWISNEINSVRCSSSSARRAFRMA